MKTNNTSKAETKPTIATLKSFVLKNRENLLIKVETCFDGMTDGIEANINPSWKSITRKEIATENTLGIDGFWVVGRGNDAIRRITEGNITGFHVYNCCGSFSIGIK